MSHVTLTMSQSVMVCAWSHSFRKNNHRTALMESPMMATLPIVQYNPYHQPASLDLYWTSVGIHFPTLLPPENHHSYHCHCQPAPHAIHRSTPRAPQAPCMFHVTGLSHHACTSSQGHEFQLSQGLLRIWVSTLWHPSEYEPFCNMFHNYHMLSKITPYMFMSLSV